MAFLVTVVLIASVRLVENAISSKNVSTENFHSNFVEEYPEARTTPKTDRFRLQTPPAGGKALGYPEKEPIELKNASLRMGKKTLNGGVISDASNSAEPSRRYMESEGSEMNGPNQQSEIIVDMTKRPYMASVRMKNSHVCGATLVGTLWVLTAAGCVQFDPADMSVLAGTPHIYTEPVDDGMMQLRLAAMAISHDNFVQPHKLNNIALIKVKRPFILTRWVNVLPIPWVPFWKPDAECTTCNWVSMGSSRYDHLICQPITFMNEDTCAMQPFLTGMRRDHCSTLLCSLGRVADVRISQISSGGPVVCQDKGVGILFHSSVLDNNVHRFFTRIDQFMVFITKHIPDFQPAPPPNDLISTLLKGFKLRLNVTLTGKFCLPDAE